MAFLFVSDDMGWGRKNLKNDNNDLFFVGSGEAAGSTEKETVEAVSFDLVTSSFLQLKLIPFTLEDQAFNRKETLWSFANNC